jgi:hypothetical protein
MIADLERALAFVRHVAIGACNAGPGVNALVPHLEFGMLSLESWRARVRMRPVFVAGLFVVVWQSLHVATARWLDFSQPSYCSLMMWQLAQDAGLLVKYDPPFA